MCLDACFTQKRRHSPRDAEHHHPASVFLSEDKVQHAQDMVSKLRKSHPAADNLVQGMQVSAAILQDCHDSFKAADEQRVKASTQFFSDTGLMALLCRHDIVLWMVNMTSAGEKQYYALALLWELLSNLPKTMTVGCLYDIGCQLHPESTLEFLSSMPLLITGLVNWSIIQESVKGLAFLMVKGVRG